MLVVPARAAPARMQGVELPSTAAAASTQSPAGSLSNIAGSAMQHKKKKRSAKVVLEREPFKPRSKEIEEEEQQRPAAVVASEVAAVKEEADAFAEKVKRLHEEGGSKWLVILDGLEREVMGRKAKSDHSFFFLTFWKNTGNRLPKARPSSLQEWEPSPAKEQHRCERWKHHRASNIHSITLNNSFTFCK